MLHRGGLHEKATWAGEPGWSLTAPEPLFCFQHPPLAPFHETGHVKRVFSASSETRNCFLCRRHPAGGRETATREWSRQLGKDGRDRLWVVTNTGQHLQVGYSCADFSYPHPLKCIFSLKYVVFIHCRNKGCFGKYTLVNQEISHSRDSVPKGLQNYTKAKPKGQSHSPWLWWRKKKKVSNLLSGTFPEALKW